MPVRKPQACIGCARKIETNERAAALSLFSQTVGMGKQRTSKSERLYLCTQCAVVTAMGDPPPRSHPIEVAAYRTLRHLVATDPAVVEAAYVSLHDAVVTPALPEPEFLPPARHQLQTAS